MLSLSFQWAFADGFLDPAQPVYLSPLLEWWMESELTYSESTQDLGQSGVSLLETTTNDMVVSFDARFRMRERLALQLIFQYQLQENSDDSATSAGQQLGYSSSSNSSQGLAEPTIGLIYPFLFMKGKWLWHFLYSPSLGAQKAATSNQSGNFQRGGSLLATELRAQWKSKRLRPYGEIGIYRFSDQNISSDGTSDNQSGYMETRIRAGLYGYFDKQYTGELSLTMINSGARSRSQFEIPGILSRQIELRANYLYKPKWTFGIAYVFANFPAYELSTSSTPFEISAANSNAIRFNTVIVF